MVRSVGERVPSESRGLPLGLRIYEGKAIQILNEEIYIKSLTLVVDMLATRKSLPPNHHAIPTQIYSKSTRPMRFPMVRTADKPRDSEGESERLLFSDGV